MRILFLEPPRRIWPYMNFEDNYLTRQAYLCLAAMVRDNGFKEVEILDCMPLRMGWKSLARELRNRRPDVVAIGENHALYADEAIAGFRLVKQILPNAITIAGGSHFSHLADVYLGGPDSPRSAPRPPWLRSPPIGTIDYIVKGEGELTLVELLQRLVDRRVPVDDVPGLAFNSNNTVIHTAVRPLIEDLDTLPLPAYDLLPMERYGRAKLLFSPGGTTVYHSRGCAHNCSFCVWWTQMAKRTVNPTTGREELRPCWRTKSVDRMMEEVELLSGTYQKRGLVFVDDCWNLDARWNLDFAKAMQKLDTKINWFAFLRADYLLRDHDKGILPELVKGGLSHVSIGVERQEDETLSLFGKTRYSEKNTRRAFAVLKKNHPTVFRQGTFIVGVPDETPESMWRQLQFAKELELDYPGFHPLTPVPGTPLWEQALQQGDLEADNFTQFDWATPVVASKSMSRHEIEETLIAMEKAYVTLPWLVRGLTGSTSYRRNMYRWFVKVSAHMSCSLLRHMILPGQGPLVPLLRPDWYDR